MSVGCDIIRKFEKSRGHKGNIAQKPSNNQISRSMPKTNQSDQSDKVLDKKIRYSTQKIRGPLVKEKSELTHGENFYVLLE